MEKTMKYPIGKLGNIALNHLKEHRPKMFKALEESGTLMQTIYEMQESTKEAMRKIEAQLKEKNPAPQTEDTMELYRYNQWTADTAWEMVKDRILLPDEEDRPEL